MCEYVWNLDHVEQVAVVLFNDMESSILRSMRVKCVQLSLLLLNYYVQSCRVRIFEAQCFQISSVADWIMCVLDYYLCQGLWFFFVFFFSKENVTNEEILSAYNFKDEYVATCMRVKDCLSRPVLQTLAFFCFSFSHLLVFLI